MIEKRELDKMIEVLQRSKTNVFNLQNATVFFAKHSIFRNSNIFLQGDSAKCAQILFLVLCTCISSIINFQLLTFQFLII